MTGKIKPKLSSATEQNNETEKGKPRAEAATNPEGGEVPFLQSKHRRFSLEDVLKWPRQKAPDYF